MVFNFADINYDDRPVLILKNAECQPIGSLGYATNITLDVNYNEVSTLEFDLPAYESGVKVPYYDDVKSMRIVGIPGLGQYTLVAPEEVDEGVNCKKKCKAYSLEYEFAYKKITLANDTYKFWDLDMDIRPDTVLGMIMELMPSWHVGTIPDSIAKKYRTFEINNDNLFNFIKGTLQQSFECIFEFDTDNRIVHVRDVDGRVRTQPVYLSTDNLAKSISLSENAEDIVTRLDVNGADGVDIRDVNPTGTNQIINLDYFMTPDNFPTRVINKYRAWKTLCNSNRSTYYSTSIKYSLLLMEKATKQAELADLQGELTSLDNQRGVIIQAIAQGVSTQSALDAINAQYSAKQAEITAKNTEITQTETALNAAYAALQAIVSACSYFGTSFTDNDRELMDKYIKDGDVTDSSFVANEVETYDGASVTQKFTSAQFRVINTSIASSQSGSETIYDLRGGTMTIGSALSAQVVSCVASVNSGNVMITAYLNLGSLSGTAFTSGCVSLSGTATSVSANESTATLSMTFTGFMYFTANASEFQKRSVAWDLYEYGERMAERLSQPTYTFSVNSANFLSLADYIAFRDHLRLGDRIYLDTTKGVLTPVLTGAKIQLEDKPSLELKFSDSFVGNDTAFKLADLLEQSVSMGRTVEAGRFNYESFIKTGAATSIHAYMQSALDVSRNAILSTTDQAISWDAAGLRLRKYSNQAQTAFDDKQIWMTNNSILMTDDGWETAKMAIGYYHDGNVGDQWGILAPMIVGTLIAGSSLMIESEKKSGGTSVFKVDGNGCYLYNSEIAVVGSGTDPKQVLINPDVGILIGKYPLMNNDDTVNTNNRTFWVDGNGNAFFSGSLVAASGTFTGAVSIETSQTSSARRNRVYINGTDGILVFDDNSNYMHIASGFMGFCDSDSFAKFWVRSDGDVCFSGSLIGYVYQAGVGIGQAILEIGQYGYDWKEEASASGGQFYYMGTDGLSFGTRYTGGVVSNIAFGITNYYNSGEDKFYPYISDMIFRDETNATLQWHSLTTIQNSSPTAVTPATNDIGGGELRYAKIGNHVFIRGGIDAMMGDVIGKLPDGFHPTSGPVYKIAYCVGGYIALIRFNTYTGTTAQDVDIAWIKKITDGSNVTGTQVAIDCNCDFFI